MTGHSNDPILGWQSVLTGREHCIRAKFQLGSVTYRLSVTDPEVRIPLLAGPDGTFPYPSDTLVCVSLGEVFHGFAYKLAAGIITRQRAGG